MSSHRALALLACLVLGSSSLPTYAHAEGVSAAKSPAKPNFTVSTANLPGPNGGVDWGVAEGVIDARPADVVAILRDYGRYAGLFPHFEKSRVLSQRGADAIVYLEANILFGATTLWGQVRMSATSPAPTTDVIEAKMMRGKGNMAQLLARWEVTPVDEGRRSKVAFQLLVDPDLPVPNSVVSREMKNSAGMAFRALRKRVSQQHSFAAAPATTM